MKKLAGFLLAAILLCTCMSGLAEAVTPRLEAQTVRLNDGTMDLVVYASTNENLQPTDFSVMMGTTQVPVTAVSSLQRSGMHTTWLLVMDTYNSDGRETMKVLASELVNLMDENDNAAIMPTGTSVQEIHLTQDKAEMLAAINGIQKNDDNTLNATISAALDYLANSQDTLERTCLVILSSDKTEGSGETYAELARKAEASRTTVYTASLNASAASTENVNEFSAIARTGHGSQAFELFGFDNYEEDAREIAQSMASREQSFRVLSVNLTDMADVNQTVTVSMMDGSMQLSTSLTLTAEEQSQLGSASSSGPEATLEPDTISVTGEEDGNISNDAEDETVGADEATVQGLLEEYGVYIGVGAAVVLIVVIVLIRAARRKKRDQEEPEIQHIRGAFRSTLNREESENSAPLEMKDEPPRKEEKSSPSPLSSTEGILLRLEKVDGDEVYEGKLINTLIVGRTRGKSDIVIPGDAKISGAHVEFSLRKGVLYVSDYQSKNGTKLNDTPVVAPTLVHINDVLTIGLTRLRIKW